MNTYYLCDPLSLLPASQHTGWRVLIAVTGSSESSRAEVKAHALEAVQYKFGDELYEQCLKRVQMWPTWEFPINERTDVKPILPKEDWTINTQPVWSVDEVEHAKYFNLLLLGRWDARNWKCCFNGETYDLELRVSYWQIGISYSSPKYKYEYNLFVDGKPPFLHWQSEEPLAEFKAVSEEAFKKYAMLFEPARTAAMTDSEVRIMVLRGMYKLRDRESGECDHKDFLGKISESRFDRIFRQLADNGLIELQFDRISRRLVERGIIKLTSTEEKYFGYTHGVITTAGVDYIEGFPNQGDPGFLDLVQKDVDNFFKEHAHDVYIKLQKASDLAAKADLENAALLLTVVRRALNAAADFFYPPVKGKGKVMCADGMERDLGEDKYLNRLREFLAKRKASTANHLLDAELEAFGKFLDRLNNLASKGVHASVTQPRRNRGLLDCTCSSLTSLKILYRKRILDLSNSPLPESVSNREATWPMLTAPPGNSWIRVVCRSRGWGFIRVQAVGLTVAVDFS